jgi:carbamate kinase
MEGKKKLCCIALGGNALIRAKEKGTYEQQIKNVNLTMDALVKLIKAGYNMVLSHGNGPQVGNVLLQNEAGSEMFEVAKMPLDLCGAQTQGSIGYLFDQCLTNSLAKEGIDRHVVPFLAQVVVSKDDKAFQNPTKPIGPYYTKEKADKYAKETGDIYREDPKGNGWRKVVPSPQPMEVENIQLVRRLVNEGYICITSGGGGIPVIRENGQLKGIEAVLDKDLSSALVAAETGADEFYILTDVPKVYINFHKPGEKALDTLTIEEAEKYLAEGQFTEGSMAPKIRAALYYMKHGGKECIITEAGQLGDPTCGTRIVCKK